MELEKRLCAMGLTEYQARCVTALLEVGNASAKDIAIRAAVPYSHIYHVLRELEESKWVKRHDGRPALYSVTDINMQIDRYVESQKREADSLKGMIEKISKEGHHEMKPTFSVHRGEKALAATISKMVASSHGATVVIGARHHVTGQIFKPFSEKFLRTTVFVKRTLLPDTDIGAALLQMRTFGDIRLLPFTPPVLLFLFDDTTFVIVFFQNESLDTHYIVVSDLEMGKWIKMLISIAYQESVPLQDAGIG